MIMLVDMFKIFLKMEMDLTIKKVKMRQYFEIKVESK